LVPKPEPEMVIDCPVATIPWTLLMLGCPQRNAGNSANAVVRIAWTATTPWFLAGGGMSILSDRTEDSIA
jgi:hypothetical protein